MTKNWSYYYWQKCIKNWSTLLLTKLYQKLINIIFDKVHLMLQVLTETSYTRSVDWWGLGVLIFEMLVGEVRNSDFILTFIFQLFNFSIVFFVQMAHIKPVYGVIQGQSPQANFSFFSQKVVGEICLTTPITHILENPDFPPFKPLNVTPV